MFVYYINVPLNAAGIKEFENYDDEMQNVKTYELTKDEYDSLRASGKLFQKFDEAFGIIIDVCEEERILNEDLSRAIEICEKFLKKNLTKDELMGTKKIIDALQLAFDSGTFCEIDIYLE